MKRKLKIVLKNLSSQAASVQNENEKMNLFLLVCKYKQKRVIGLLALMRFPSLSTIY
jgi:hypothetical protein